MGWNDDGVLPPTHAVHECNCRSMTRRVCLPVQAACFDRAGLSCDVLMRPVSPTGAELVRGEGGPLCPPFPPANWSRGFPIERNVARCPVTGVVINATSGRFTRYARGRMREAGL